MNIKITASAGKFLNLIIRLLKKYYFILTPLMIYVSFPFSEIDSNGILSVFAWISLVPIIVYMRNKNYRQSWKAVLFISLLSNLITFGWMREFGAQIQYGTVIVLIVLIPAISVFTFTKFILMESLRKRFPHLSVLIYPGIWVLIDFIQSIGYLAFPWVYWSYTQYQFDSFIQIASITGVFGISWIMITFNILLAETIMNFKNKKTGRIYLTGLAVYIFFIILVIFWGHNRIINFNEKQKSTVSKNTLKVAFVQSCISPFENWYQNRFRYLDDLIHYSKLALNEQPDTELILWTESSALETITYNYERGICNEFENAVIDFAAENKVNLYTGEIGRIDNYSKMRIQFQNSAVLIDHNGKIDGNYSKIHLCPFGEWFPYGNWMNWFDDVIVELGGAAFVPGKEEKLFNVDDKKFGALICYESLFFRQNRDYRNMGADFLVLITNDGWTDYFKGHMQHFPASKFRAVENGIYFLRAGNTGFTAVINPLGIVEKSIPILKQGFLTDEINTDLKIETFYTKHGDILYYIAELLFIIILTFNYLYINIFSAKEKLK
ncbi:MAG: apolipoprotein N-acyltransferase [Spirochaetes bacterium]|nr:apolipoprotein N-acyltransferase [Spirochaetota bacterium]